MAKSNVITVIDLGTEKCVILVATTDPEKRQHLEILGVSVVPTSGMKRSQIVNLEKIIDTLTQGLDAAERMAGMHLNECLISISGTHIESYNSKGVVAVANPNQEITPQDVDRVIDAAQAISLPPGRSIIHIIPRDYSVDSQSGIKDPIGMTGIRLESEAHIITGLNTAINNSQKCINDVGLNVVEVVFSGLAAAEATLTETEKELGVVAVDIGAGSTAICAYVDGSLAYSAALPIGARHITQDIALGCRVSLDNAEKIKLALSQSPPQPVMPIKGESKEDLRKRRQQENDLNLASIGVDESLESMSKKTLIEGIMVPRMKEIFTMIGKSLKDKKIFDLVPAGLVISGGGAETVAIAEVAKRTLNLPARIGKPPQLGSLAHDLEKPAHATSVGLLLYGLHHQVRMSSGGGLTLGSFMKSIPAGNVLKKLVSFFKSLLP